MSRSQMPTCCRFRDRATKETISLLKLDEILCREYNIPIQEKRMCWMYDMICLIGIGILMQSGEGVVTQTAFETYMENSNGENHALLERFLVREYEFEAWHESR